MLSLFNRLFQRYSSPELWRYLVIAVVGVGIEIGSFQLMLMGHISYLVATPASMFIAIIYNWYMSQKYVFKHRPHAPRKEFMLVAIASLIGLALQMTVTVLVVEVAKGMPLAGKLIAICVTFFWNFWFRKKYIFYAPTDKA